MDAKLIEKLVPAELRERYTFSRNGIITDPGKFEGEPIETLYFYDCYMDGDGTVMEVSQEERDAFGLPESDKWVYLEESNDGFVSLVYFETQEAAEEYQNEIEGNDDESDDESDGELLDNPSCPACDGPGVPLGNLGNTHYFRCQDCGLTFSGPATDDFRR